MAMAQVTVEICCRAARRSAFVGGISRQITLEMPAHVGDIDPQLAGVSLAVNSTTGRSTGELVYVDRRTCFAPPLYVHRGRAIDFHHRSLERAAYPHRYFSQHRHTGAEHRLDVQRLLREGHG